LWITQEFFGICTAENSKIEYEVLCSLLFSMNAGH